MNDLFYKLRLYGFAKFVYFGLCEVSRFIFWQGIRKSYSQKGEDILIDRILGHKTPGFYIDVGASDPLRFSNTKRFYDRGWSGINLEPNYRNFLKLTSARPRDINLNLGLGAHRSHLMFYEFVPNTLSTFSSHQAQEYVRQGYILRRKRRIDVRTLKEIKRYYVKNKKVDFLSVDTEGMDYAVLQGNDWKRLRPTVVCVESAEFSGRKSQLGQKIDRLLLRWGYRSVYDTHLNTIYALESTYDQKSNNKQSFYRVQEETFDTFASHLTTKDFFKEDTALHREYEFVLDLMGNLKGKSVLDVGCGTGRYALRIAKRARQVVGIDISKESIAYAKKVAQLYGIKNFRGEVNNFSKPKYRNYFDFVLMVNTIHHVQDITMLLTNAKKVLKDDGSLIIFEFNPLNPLFIPFLAMQKQIRSHVNREYFRSNQYTLKRYLTMGGWNIVLFRRYAFLPTILYNYSMAFERLNDALNVVPVVNLFSAFHVLKCQKNEASY